jgi:hypothetical protein
MRHGKMRSEYRILIEYSEENISLGRSTRRWEDNIYIGPKKLKENCRLPSSGSE